MDHHPDGFLMRPFRRLGWSLADLLIVAGALTLAAALAVPLLRARAFDATLDQAVLDVDVLEGGARGIFDRSGEWPTDTGIGEIPQGLHGAFPADTTLARDSYSLQWRVLESADRVAAPAAAPLPEDADAAPDSVPTATVYEIRTLGRILLHSSDDELLAELLSHYGNERSFVRDSTWTLVIGAS